MRPSGCAALRRGVRVTVPSSPVAGAPRHNHIGPLDEAVCSGAPRGGATSGRRGAPPFSRALATHFGSLSPVAGPVKRRETPEAEAVKVCSRCGEAKPLTAFYRDKRHSDGRTTECKACKSAQSTAWRRTQRCHLDYNRAKRLQKRGVQIIDIVRRPVVWERAGGKCEACGRALPMKGGPQGDIDHRVAVRDGGEHSYSNAQLLCHVPCHQLKTDAVPEGGVVPCQPVLRRYFGTRPALISRRHRAISRTSASRSRRRPSTPACGRFTTAQCGPLG